MAKGKCDTSSSFSERPISSKCCNKKEKDSCSSEESEQCVYVKKCNPCGEKDCSNICPSDGENAAKLCCKYSNAVVKIESAFVLTALNGASLAAGTTISAGNHTDIFMQGNGFFIRGHYIICPAHLVLIPPTLLANANRYPFVAANQPSPSGIYPTNITAASRIMVTVSHVNNTKLTYVYEAELKGVDGTGDIAILCINSNSLANVKTPCIEKCHPYFCFGKSCEQVCGDKVYAIGNPDGRGRFGPDGIVSGTVISNAYADEIGQAQAQLFVADFDIYWKSSGLPILDKYGKVVAMQTLSEMGTNLPENLSPFVTAGGDNIVAGPAQHFMKRVIYTIVQGNCGKNRDQVENVADVGLPPYLRYKKGFMGLAWYVATGMDFFTTTIANAGNTLLPAQQVNFLNNAFTAGPCCKQVIGVRVLALAGGPTYSFANIPGGAATGTFPVLPVSPLLPYVTQDDIITHINRKELGNNGKDCCSCPPSCKLWEVIGNGSCNVDITYRKYSDNYQNTYGANINVVDTPALFDYPWYKIAEVPIVPAPLAVPASAVNQLPSAAFKPAV